MSSEDGVHDVWLYGDDAAEELRQLGARYDVTVQAALGALADHLLFVCKTLEAVDINHRHHKWEPGCACRECSACVEKAKPENILAAIKALLPPDLLLEATRKSLAAEIIKAQTVLDALGG